MFKSCPRKYFFAAVKRKVRPDEDGSPRQIGTDVHETLALFFARRKEDRQLTWGEWYVNECGGHPPQKREGEVSPEALQTLAGLAADDGCLGAHFPEWTVHRVEERLWAAPKRGYRLTGRIDLVVRDPQGRMIVIDHKTTKRHKAEGYWTYNEQPVAYAWLVRENYGETPSACVINEIRVGDGDRKTAHICIDDAHLDAFEARLRREISFPFDRHTEWWPNMGMLCSGWCDYASPCYTMEQGGDWETVLGLGYVDRETSEWDAE